MMGTKKISELALGTLTDGDIVIGNEGGVTKGLTHATDIVQDTTPVLGGNLDGGTNDITNVGNISITTNITVGGTVDGRAVATDGTKLDTIETSADVTDTANVTSAGALMDSELTSIVDVKALDQSVVSGAAPVFAGTNLTDTGASFTAGTVTTNANLSGDVTSSGSNVTTIAPGAVDVAMIANGTDGELITWNASGNPDVVAVGTATHVLTSNGAGAPPTFQVTPAGGDLVTDTSPQLGGDLDLNTFNIDFPTTANISDCLDEDTMSSDSATKICTQQSIKAYQDALGVVLTSGTASGVASLDITGISSTHPSIDVYISELVPSADGVIIRLRTSTDGGSTFDSGATDYEYVYTQHDSSGTVSTDNESAGDSFINIFNNIGNAAGECMGMNFTLTNHGSASIQTLVHFQGSSVASTGALRGIRGSGIRSSAADVDAIQIGTSSGTVSFKYLVIGRKM